MTLEHQITVSIHLLHSKIAVLRDEEEAGTTPEVRKIRLRRQCEALARAVEHYERAVEHYKTALMLEEAVTVAASKVSPARCGYRDDL